MIRYKSTGPVEPLAGKRNGNKNLRFIYFDPVYENLFEIQTINQVLLQINNENLLNRNVFISQGYIPLSVKGTECQTFFFSYTID
jgi:hypothetical protein